MEVTVGDNSVTNIKVANITNKPLKHDTEYCVTFLFISDERNSETIEVFCEKYIRTKPFSKSAKVYARNDTFTTFSTMLIFLFMLAIFGGALVAYR